MAPFYLCISSLKTEIFWIQSIFVQGGWQGVWWAYVMAAVGTEDIGHKLRPNSAMRHRTLVHLFEIVVYLPLLMKCNCFFPLQRFRWGHSVITSFKFERIRKKKVQLIWIGILFVHSPIHIIIFIIYSFFHSSNQSSCCGMLMLTKVWIQISHSTFLSAFVDVQSGIGIGVGNWTNGIWWSFDDDDDDDGSSILNNYILKIYSIVVAFMYYVW